LLIGSPVFVTSELSLLRGLGGCRVILLRKRSSGTKGEASSQQATECYAIDWVLHGVSPVFPLHL